MCEPDAEIIPGFHTVRIQDLFKDAERLQAINCQLAYYIQGGLSPWSSYDIVVFSNGSHVLFENSHRMKSEDLAIAAIDTLSSWSSLEPDDFVTMITPLYCVDGIWSITLRSPYKKQDCIVFTTSLIKGPNAPESLIETIKIRMQNVARECAILRHEKDVELKKVDYLIRSTHVLRQVHGSWTFCPLQKADFFSRINTSTS